MHATKCCLRDISVYPPTPCRIESPPTQQRKTDIYRMTAKRSLKTSGLPSQKQTKPTRKKRTPGTPSSTLMSKKKKHSSDDGRLLTPKRLASRSSAFRCLVTARCCRPRRWRRRTRHSGRWVLHVLWFPDPVRLVSSAHIFLIKIMLRDLPTLPCHAHATVSCTSVKARRLLQVLLTPDALSIAEACFGQCIIVTPVPSNLETSQC